MIHFQLAVHLRTRKSQGGEIVKPETPAIRLALDDKEMASLSSVAESIETVWDDPTLSVDPQESVL